jgi:soluble lytic murein transglycosylase-like protein
MKIIRNTKGFRVIAALIGLFTIYVGLLVHGKRVNAVPVKTSAPKIKMTRSKKDDSGIKYRGLIISAASKHNVPPALIAAIMHAESNFNPRAVSPVGARGLMQINGVTQKHLGVRNIFDPRQNVNAGAKYLRELLNTFRGNKHMAIAAYNAGPGAVRKYKGIPPYSETRKYVAKVTKLYAIYSHQLPTSLMIAQN